MTSTTDGYILHIACLNTCMHRLSYRCPIWKNLIKNPALHAYIRMFIRVCMCVEPLYNGHFGTRYFCGHFLLQYRGFPLSKVKNLLVTPVETKIFTDLKDFLREVPLYTLY